jgi:hypothetical protein
MVEYFSWAVPVAVYFGDHWYGPAAFILFIGQCYRLYLGVKKDKKDLKEKN